MNQTTVGEDRSTGTIVNSLAAVYYSTGRYAEAESMYRRALKIEEQTVGPEHPYVAVALENLATVQKEIAKYSAAEPLLNRALAIRERAEGLTTTPAWSKR